MKTRLNSPRQIETNKQQPSTMNETQCSELIESVFWTDPKNLASLAILGFIDILVVVGNCLVIAAVFCSQKLRSVTNFFIGENKECPEIE